MKKYIFKSLVYVTMMSAPLFMASCDEFGTDDNPAGAYISMDYNNVGRGHLARCFNEANAATTEELHLLAQKYFTEDGFLEAIAGKKLNKS